MNYTLEDIKKQSPYPIGELNTAYAKYFVGNSYLYSINDQEVLISNVTFEPGCRNNWHIHHGAGQILLCTAGRGYYQEWGKEPVELFPGDETVEPFGPLAHCDIFSPHGFRVSRCLLKESLPERIKPRQILGRKASGLLSPLLFPHGISPDSRRQHIIFHIIDGLRCKIHQAAAKEAENRLIAVIADQHFQRRLHKFQERI